MPVKTAKMVDFMFCIFYHNKDVLCELGQFRLKEDDVLKVKNQGLKFQGGTSVGNSSNPKLEAQLTAH